MVQQIIKIKEGKLKDIELPSLWLRERVVGDNFVDKNNLQRLYEPALLDENLKITDFNVTDNFLNIFFSDGKNGAVAIRAGVAEARHCGTIWFFEVISAEQPQ